MHSDYPKMFELMEQCLADFSGAVPSPELVDLGFGPVFRYHEKCIYQAMIQKLARVLSAVRAALLLLQNGYVQEQAILHRVIDETNEDIMFLVYAVSNDKITELHQRFLDAFWEEEVDESREILTSAQKRPMIPRQKIRVYLANVEGLNIDPGSTIELHRTISKAYSGFVHGASPHIMDMYGGEPSRFHTSGMLGTPRVDEHANDLWNYMYRSFISFMAVAKAFGAAEHVDMLYKWKEEFEKNEGKSY